LKHQEKQDVDENQRAADNANVQANRSIAPTVNLQVDLAVQRTELALDRTQLAWVRTAFTFITAGLAIDKGAEALHEARLLAGTNWVAGSYAVGITLTAASTLFLLVASVLYFQQARALARIKGAEPPWFPLALLISLLVVLLGGTLSIFMLTWR
jgi:putative membrane protein